MGTVTSKVNGVKLDFGGGIGTPCGLEKSGRERAMDHTYQKLETLARPSFSLDQFFLAGSF